MGLKMIRSNSDPHLIWSEYTTSQMILNDPKYANAAATQDEFSFKNIYIFVEHNNWVTMLRPIQFLTSIRRNSHNQATFHRQSKLISNAFFFLDVNYFRSNATIHFIAFFIDDNDNWNVLKIFSHTFNIEWAHCPSHFSVALSRTLCPCTVPFFNWNNSINLMFWCVFVNICLTFDNIKQFWQFKQLQWPIVDIKWMANLNKSIWNDWCKRLQINFYKYLNAANFFFFELKNSIIIIAFLLFGIKRERVKNGACQ